MAHQVVSSQREACVHVHVQQRFAVVLFSQLPSVPEELLILHGDAKLRCDGSLDVPDRLFVLHPARRTRWAVSPPFATMNGLRLLAGKTVRTHCRCSCSVVAPFGAAGVVFMSVCFLSAGVLSHRKVRKGGQLSSFHSNRWPRMLHDSCAVMYAIEGNVGERIIHQSLWTDQSINK